jgi:hypothetical protein
MVDTWRASRRLWWLAVAIGGCTQNTPSGVTLHDQSTVSVIYRPCAGRVRGIGRLALYDDLDLSGRQSRRPRSPTRLRRLWSCPFPRRCLGTESSTDGLGCSVLRAFTGRSRNPTPACRGRGRSSSPLPSGRGRFCTRADTRRRPSGRIVSPGQGRERVLPPSGTQAPPLLGAAWAVRCTLGAGRGVHRQLRGESRRAAPSCSSWCVATVGRSF